MIYKRILLIGGSGFLGRNLINSFLGSCDKLVVLIRSKKQILDISPNQENIQFVEAEIADTDKIKKLIDLFNIEIVMHLASELIPSSNKTDFFTEFEEIVIPTFKILHFLAQKKVKIIFFSSAGVIYGNQETVITEKTDPKPLNYYGYSKLLIEQHILLLSRILDLAYVIVRPSNVYGKYGKINKLQGFIELATEKILNDEPIEIWGSGNQTRDFIHITDFTKIIGQILSSNIKNEIINVAYGKSYSLLKIIEILEKSLNVKSTLIFSKRKIHIEHVKFDVSHLKSFFNYNLTSIDDGIELFLKNYQKNT